MRVAKNLVGHDQMRSWFLQMLWELHYWFPWQRLLWQKQYEQGKKQQQKHAIIRGRATRGLVLSTVVEGLGTQRMTSMRGDIKFIACPLERVSIYWPSCPIQSLFNIFNILVVLRSFSIAINNVTYSWVPSRPAPLALCTCSITHLFNELTKCQDSWVTLPSGWFPP